MPDGFEYCFSFKDVHPLKLTSELLNPSNASDGYSDWDEDGLNNLEEYQVALKFGLLNGLPSFTSPWSEDTDGDGMPDGWEASQYNRTHSSTRSIHVTPAMQMMTLISMVGIRWRRRRRFRWARIDNHRCRCLRGEGDYVTANTTVARGQYTVGGGAKETVYLVAPVDGYVYHIHVAPGDQVESVSSYG